MERGERCCERLRWGPVPSDYWRPHTPWKSLLWWQGPRSHGLKPHLPCPLRQPRFFLCNLIPLLPPSTTQGALHAGRRSFRRGRGIGVTTSLALNRTSFFSLKMGCSAQSLGHLYTSRFARQSTHAYNDLLLSWPRRRLRAPRRSTRLWAPSLWPRAPPPAPKRLARLHLRRFKSFEPLLSHVSHCDASFQLLGSSHRRPLAEHSGHLRILESLSSWG